MTIQIDRSVLLPQVEERIRKRNFYSSHQKESMSLADETINLCQQWLDNKSYAGKGIETRSDFKRELYAGVLDGIDLRNRRKSYFVPTFVWVWLAQKLIWYIIEKIIESYWLNDEPEQSLFYLLK